MLKLLMAFVAGVLTFLTLRHIVQQLRTARKTVVIQRNGARNPITRLRRDPATGVYSPEA